MYSGCTEVSAHKETEVPNKKENFNKKKERKEKAHNSMTHSLCSRSYHRRRRMPTSLNEARGNGVQSRQDFCGADMADTLLALEDQAHSNVQFVRPAPCTRGVAQHDRIRSHAAFHKLEMGLERWSRVEGR